MCQTSVLESANNTCVLYWDWLVSSRALCWDWLLLVISRVLYRGVIKIYILITFNLKLIIIKIKGKRLRDYYVNTISTDS